jgi:RNA methyltransferase, TrmH family
MSSHTHPYIDHVKHVVLKKMRDFQQRKNRNQSYMMVIDGSKELAWALERNAQIETLLVTEAAIDSPAVVECEHQRVNIYIVTDSIFRRYFSSSGQNAVAALVHAQKTEITSSQKMAFFLEDIIDQGNIGSIIRTSCAFGINNFFGNNFELDWFSKKSIKASRGSHFDAKFHTFNSTKEGILFLKKAGFQIIGTSPCAKNLISLSQIQKKPAILMIGNEQHGLSEIAIKNADMMVRIPMMEQVESLNVSIAAKISLYELYFRLVITMLTNNIQQNIGRNIGVLFQLFPQVLNENLKSACDLNANQIIFLMILKLDGTMNQSQIEKDLSRLGEDPAATIEKFLHNNYMEKVLGVKNSFQISLKGEQDLTKLWMIIENTEAKILSVLSELEQKEFRSMLTRLKHNCINLLEGKANKP